nr:hypothetical protein [uncultured Chitinophaga sp.]
MLKSIYKSLFFSCLVLLFPLAASSAGSSVAAGALKPDTSGGCFSGITEVSVNPYVYGIAGNWRPARSYVYYGSRAEEDPAAETNIRTNGTLPSFIAFWNNVAGVWQPSKDTSRWVWNAESTLFNAKGFELENHDPLGRYNAGIYGYDNALPVAVVQNSRYRESFAEGFEDYSYGKTQCDAACSGTRTFDFSGHQDAIVQGNAHTGRYAIKVATGTNRGVSAMVVPSDNQDFTLTVNRKTATCPYNAQVLESVRAGDPALLPGFSPIQGTRLLISAWAKEETPCNCITYTNAAIEVQTGGKIFHVTPVGYLIDGWQRYEMVIDVPANATTLSVILKSLGKTAVYFDDLRIHPFNANMKSFVYDPVTLRMMAELDENNYASFYEYDDDGTLIRLKKETERGVMTIKETRSSLAKE